MPLRLGQEEISCSFHAVHSAASPKESLFILPHHNSGVNLTAISLNNFDFALAAKPRFYVLGRKRLN